MSAVARRTGQTPPLHQQALGALFRTTDAVRRAMARVLEPHGLTGTQYNVLRILRGARPAPLPTMEIAARMMEQTPGITRLLDRLEAKELVSRERCSDDRRQVLCSITPLGVELLAALDEPIDRADEALFASLKEAELQGLLRHLAAIREQAQ